MAFHKNRREGESLKKTEQKHATHIREQCNQSCIRSTGLVHRGKEQTTYNNKYKIHQICRTINLHIAMKYTRIKIVTKVSENGSSMLKISHLTVTKQKLETFLITETPTCTLVSKLLEKVNIKFCYRISLTKYSKIRELH